MIISNIKIAQTAKTYIGQTEKPLNSGFTSDSFEKKMKAVGWQKKQAWCSYFCELVCKEAMPELTQILDKLFSASATETWKNFDIAQMTSETPKIGSLAVWRFGNGWSGHIGIVSQVIDLNNFVTIEGNTNDGGSREGYIVCEKKRKMNKVFQPKGLNLIGFIELT